MSSKFEDLLNNPLPSSYMAESEYDNLFDESDDFDENDDSDYDYGDDTDEGCSYESDDEDDEDDEYYPYDNDDEDDEDVHGHHHDHDDEDDEDDDLDDYNLVGSISDEVDDDDDDIDPNLMDEIDDEVNGDELTPDEEKEVEDETSLIATPIILKDELTAEEYADFGESVDADIAVDEGLLLESDVNDVINDTYTESIKPMRFSKDSVLKARTNQIRWIVIRTMARKKNDPLIPKLEKCYKIRRIIKSKLEAKYGNKADIITRKYIMRLKRSKSPVLSSIGKKIGIKH